MKSRLLRFLRLDPEPSPPAGSEGSLRVFRSSRRFLGYSYLSWSMKQGSAFIGILFSLGFMERFIASRVGRLEEWVERASDSRIDVDLGPFQTIVLPFFTAFEWMEWVGLGLYFAQFVVSGLLLKLAWEMRWYMVTDESVRIREGLFRVREQTLTIAKIQNLKVRQGPLQRLFGISDLEVQTAGGGSGGSSPGEDLEKRHAAHIGHFRGLRDVGALRDRLQRLQDRHRHAGLGETRERRAGVAPTGGPRGRAIAAAVKALVAEARRLRGALERTSAS